MTPEISLYRAIIARAVNDVLSAPAEAKTETEIENLAVAEKALAWLTSDLPPRTCGAKPCLHLQIDESRVRGKFSRTVKKVPCASFTPMKRCAKVTISQCCEHAGLDLNAVRDRIARFVKTGALPNGYNPSQ